MDELLTKVCFKCGRSLPLSSFYVHPQMGDGHLNKCKDCTRSDVHKKYMENIDNPEFVEKERARGREKYRRLGYVVKNGGDKYGTKDVRRYIEARVGKLPKDMELHHWNYNLKYQVLLLDRRTHSRLHKKLSLDESTKCFKYKDALLTTLDSHISALLDVVPGAEYTVYSF